MASTGTADTPRAARLRQGGQWLREQRDRRGWTGRHLASLLGVTPTQISNYERGRDGVDDDRALGIARAFGMDVIDVRRAIGLWVPEGYEPRVVSVEEAIHADPTLTPGQRDVLLATLAAIRLQAPDTPDPLMDYHGDPAESPWRPGGLSGGQ